MDRAIEIAGTIIAFMMIGGAAFMLGWSMRGDRIYSGLYTQQISQPVFSHLAKKIEPKRRK